MSQRDIFPRSLQYLIAIAEYGSYRRAAEVLYVSQPTISQQIKQLEESLNTTLLDRSGKTVKPTPAGEIYLAHARRAWSELDAGSRAINDVHDLNRGTLRLGWTPVTDYLTWPLLQEYHHRYPDITLNTLEMPQDDIEIAVAEDRIDIGIAFTNTLKTAARSNEIEACTLFEESLCVAVGERHHFGQREKISSAQLSKESLILLNTKFAFRRLIDRYFLDYNISPHVAIETDSLNIIIEMVQHDSLTTILPKTIVHNLQNVHPLIPLPEMPSKAITVIRRREGFKSAASIAFVETAREWAKQLPFKTMDSESMPCT
jgi:LysR family cyn operon transcriptional activator